MGSGSAGCGPATPAANASRSEADFALAGSLAFWCGPDPERIERLMRQSGLTRPKWERGGYLARTIANALKDRTEFYSPVTLRIPCGYPADTLRCLDSCVHTDTPTVREKADNANNPQPIRNQSANWELPKRIREKYDSNPWDCPDAFGVAGLADLSPALIAATCRKRSCPVCGAYWRLQTYDRFGFHLSSHDGQLYTDTVPDFDWQVTLKDMRRRAKKLEVPLRFIAVRCKEGDLLTVICFRAGFAHRGSPGRTDAGPGCVGACP